jgi:uncharacterized membrane protein
MIFFALGVADYVFVLMFVIVTGLVTRKEALMKEKQSAAEMKKPMA